MLERKDYISRDVLPHHWYRIAYMYVYTDYAMLEMYENITCDDQGFRSNSGMREFLISYEISLLFTKIIEVLTLNPEVFILSTN
jgi:hypothetical protein